MSAIDKFNARADKVDSLLCIGLDSDLARLPSAFRAQAAPQLAFNRYVIDAAAPCAAAFKFNMAFYEAYGAAGWRQLDQSLRHLRQHHPDLLTICDAKRADIGNSSAAYAQAIFNELGFDAVTLNPYLGRDALQPFLDYQGKGCIILCRTSNPGAAEIQDLAVAGQPLWRFIAQRVARDWNDHGNCMLVVSATKPDEMAQVRALTGDMTFLAPGIGAQGGDIKAALAAGLNSAGTGLIINASRSVIFADDPAAAAEALRAAINEHRP